ncbi:TPA: hypothetical protein RU524_002468 [Staphylococcus aureus]|nr:hypothetical protein [Staphylococcus aureus]HEA0050110.1 hypothetical protein [Staphylococcus aureus]HEA0105176.1 hypothetical protein [Staphylococcus aureus]HEA0108882.1 hypothetical protein [Staphylococcus aureus]HEA0113655.1 hypothetical protein [Staphylococcus aureus]
MKIKVKKEMKLTELIQWAWENPELVRGKIFYPQGKSNETYVHFNLYDGRKCLINDFISTDDTFVVEVEEEITEDTVFDRLFEVYEFLEGDYNSTLYANASINERLNDTFFPVKAFYILNDDLTMTLIWKDGELVV